MIEDPPSGRSNDARLAHSKKAPRRISITDQETFTVVSDVHRPNQYSPITRSPSGNSTVTAFSGCESLEYMHIPSTVESIRAHAFRGCKQLAWVHLLCKNWRTINSSETGSSGQLETDRECECEWIEELPPLKLPLVKSVIFINLEMP
jgi:hypothetical protein